MKNLGNPRLVLVAAASFVLAGLITGPSLSAQDDAKPKATAKKPANQKRTRTRKPNPAFAPPKNIDPKLPNVLLIGDSISIGYMVPAREKLAGVANVFRPNTNCGPTTRGLESLESEAKVGGEVNVYCGYKYFVLL